MRVGSWGISVAKRVCHCELVGLLSFGITVNPKKLETGFYKDHECLDSLYSVVKA